MIGPITLDVAHTDALHDVTVELFARKVRFVADASVFESTAVRGVVTAVNWIAPPKHPVRVFGDMESAVEWATALLVDEGLTIS